jgi:hypothetical protein
MTFDAGSPAVLIKKLIAARELPADLSSDHAADILTADF